MELKEFVQESLVQIMNGIEGASNALKETTNAHISPKNIYVNGESRQNFGRLNNQKEYNPIVSLVEFDVAVSAKEEKEDGGKIGISVCSIGIGANKKSQNEKSSESRIKFSIPVVFPSN